MSTKSDRDAAVDRLLRTSLRGSSDGVDAECLSADAIAAFVEGSLALGERDTAEAHLAACGKCQEALAALAEMPEIAPASARKGRPAWADFRWLVPASAVLTALVIYVAIKTVEAPGVPVSPTAVTLARKADEQAARNAAPRSEAAPAQAARVAEAPPQAAAARETGRPKQELLDASKPLRGAPPATLVAQNAPAAQPPRQGAADAVEIKGAPPAAAPQAVATMKAVPPPAVAEQVNAAGKAAAPLPTMARAAMPAPSAVDLKEQRVGALAESVALTAEGGGVLVVKSSDGLARWHVDSRGLVSRSVDNGLTWRPAPTGTSTPILAISSPTATIAWAVGRGGTVVRTIDGDRWARCTFPEAVDLVAVDAKDAATATVTTRDGRKFTTPDGGATWMLAR